MNIENQYLKLLKRVLHEGRVKWDRTEVGTLSVFGAQLQHDMSLGFPLLTTKRMYWKGIVTELSWFLRGDTNIRYLIQNGCNIWNGDAYKHYKQIAGSSDEIDYEVHIDDPQQNRTRLMTQKEFIDNIMNDEEFGRVWGELGPIYGKQWRDIGDIDQIENLLHLLRTNPDSRRMIVNSWNVEELDSMYLPPCHYSFQVYTQQLSLTQRTKILLQRRGKNVEIENIEPESKGVLDDANIPERSISLLWNQRSADLFLGVPFNIASYALLLELLGREVNMVPHRLIGNIGDAHIYKNHIEACLEQLERIPKRLPQLQFPKDSSIDNILNIGLWRYHPYDRIVAPLNN